LNFFKKRYADIKKDVAKFASTKNVPAQAYSFFQVFLWVMIASSILAVMTLSLISSIELPDNIITTISLNMIIPAWGIILFFGLGKYFFYAKILEIHYMQKLLSYCITKLDMMWWRKYRKQSPLTEALLKAQTKAETTKKKMSPRKRKLISIILVTVLVCAYGYTKIDLFTETIESWQAEIEHNEKIQNNLGKIYDGLK
jgi:hypothetical protein